MSHPRCWLKRSGLDFPCFDIHHSAFNLFYLKSISVLCATSVDFVVKNRNLTGKKLSSTVLANPHSPNWRQSGQNPDIFFCKFYKDVAPTVLVKKIRIGLSLLRHSSFSVQPSSFKINLWPLRHLRDLCGKKTETLPVKNYPQPFWRTRILLIVVIPAKTRVFFIWSILQRCRTSDAGSKD